MMIISDDAFDKSKPCVLYDNILTSGTVTASALAASGYSVANAYSGTTWDFYKPASAAFFVYTVDMTTATECDCAFMDAHNIVGSVYIAYSDNGSTWTRTTDNATPVNGEAVMFIWRGSSHRYWRFAFEVTNAPEIGVLMLGKRLVFPQGVDVSHTSIQHSQQFELLGGNSLSGQFTGQKIIKRSASVEVVFPLLDAAWVDTTMVDFEYHYNSGQPFAFATMPAKYPKDMGYCQRPESASELRPSYYEGGLYEEFTMALGVYVNG